MSKPLLLIVDDDKSYVEGLAAILAKEYSWRHVEHPSQVETATKKQPPDVILLDIRFGGEDIGIDYIEKLAAVAPVIILTCHDDLDLVVRTVKKGAYDYFQKDLRSEILKNKIERCLGERALRDKYAGTYGEFIGDSKAAKRIRADVARLSHIDIPVLITGETGVGKTLVAHLIHAHSPRAAKEMQVLPGPNLSELRFESEAFGQRKGAYTDAAEKPGAVELADGSTLFIDEIGDLAPGVQGMFLKVLEEKKVKRMGEAFYREVDFRLISATNHDLKTMVAEGSFRRDLYERIFGAEIHIPPLRERTRDIEPLFRHYLQRYAEQWNRPAPEYDDDFLAVLKRHHWPGNVREIDRFAARIMMQTSNRVLTAADASELVPAAKRSWDYKENLKACTLEFKRSFISRVLDYTDGNVTKAADLMNIARPSLQRMIREAGVERPQ